LTSEDFFMTLTSDDFNKTITYPRNSF
jgi:hypothetical protein